MADENKTCDHHVCSCAVNGDSDYCSPYCKTASDVVDAEVACNCGHPGCAAEL